MKLISRDGAIVGFRFLLDEVRPLRGADLGTMIRKTVERYKFLKAPNPQEVSIPNAPAKFERGTSPKGAVIRELAIFSDLYGVTATDTDDAEEFLEDFQSWLETEFGFRPPVTKLERAYQSDLVVEFDNDPDKAFELYEPLVRFVQNEVNSFWQTSTTLQFARLAFASDPMPSNVSAQFLIERRAGTAWKTNRFFCKAHMRTSAHVRALEILDELLGKAAKLSASAS